MATDDVKQSAPLVASVNVLIVEGEVDSLEASVAVHISPEKGRPSAYIIRLEFAHRL